MSDFLTAVSSLAATALSGHPVEVQYRQPYVKEYTGLATRNGDTGIIQLRPGMSAEKTLWVLLHEIAHQKLHWRTLPRRSKVHTLAQGSYRITDHAKFDARYAADRREAEAEGQARRWLNQAQKYHGDNAVKLLRLAQASFDH